MAVISKNFPATGTAVGIAQRAMLTGLVSTGVGDWSGINHINYYYGTWANGDDLTWGTITTDVSITNTPVINVDAGRTVTKLGLAGQNAGAPTSNVALIEINIDDEDFTYAGTITITSLELSISNTIG